MSSHNFPVFVHSIDEKEFFFQYFDKQFGQPGIKISKKNRGYTMRYILKHLSEYKQSTCDDIANEEIKRDYLTRRTLKFVRDDVRKFIKKNLIRFDLVYEDGFKEVYNKKVTKYSLTPLGILYSIYLVGNTAYIDRFGVSILNLDILFIKNLAKEYSQTLPKVFGKFELLEKFFGEDFESLMKSLLLRVLFNSTGDMFVYPDLLLHDHVTSFSFSVDNNAKTIQEFLAKQISLIFYIHLTTILRDVIWHRTYDFGEVGSYGSTKEFDRDEFRRIANESWNLAEKKWAQLMNEDKELRKWYEDFLKEARKSKTNQLQQLNQYYKTIFS